MAEGMYWGPPFNEKFNFDKQNCMCTQFYILKIFSPDTPYISLIEIYKLKKFTFSLIKIDFLEVS